ncbi:MAG: PqqD family protein [Clostridia bacterium]|nr:PqqD family protein [Clostridia bacterium]
MKIRGEFITRQILDDTVVLPVGNTAIEFNNMIMLNSVSLVIWQCLENDVSFDDILKAVTDNFEVSQEQAVADIREFLDGMRSYNLLDE